MRKVSIILLSLLISGSTCLGQPKLDSAYYLPKIFHKTNSWLRADKIREGLLKKDTSHSKLRVGLANIIGGRIPRELTYSDYLDMLKRQSDFYTFLNVKSQAILQYEKFFPYLISFLTDSTNVGLTDTDYSLIFAKDSPFLADTLIIKENLTTVAGRAACILNELTGENFAIVRPIATITELKKYQLLWTAWIKKLK